MSLRNLRGWRIQNKKNEKRNQQNEEGVDYQLRVIVSFNLGTNEIIRRQYELVDEKFVQQELSPMKIPRFCV